MNRIKEAYTAQELAPLLGKTERGIRFIGKRDNWDRRLRSGRSDDFEYPTIKLPADVREAIALAVSAEERESLPVVLEPATPAVVESPTVSLSHLTARERDVALARKALIDAVCNFETVGKSRRAAILLLVEAYRNGTLPRNLMEAARIANARRGASRGISTRALYNWYATYEDRGILGLVPADPKKDTSIPEWFEIFRLIWKRPQAPSLNQARREFEIVVRWVGLGMPEGGLCFLHFLDPERITKHKSLPALKPFAKNPASIPSIDAIRRIAKKMPLELLERGCRTGNAMLKIRSHKLRSTANMLPGEGFTGDGTTFDGLVQHPYEPRAFRPEITLILDIATRKCVGVSIDTSENGLTVLDAFRVACITHCVPYFFYTDNGPGYANAMSTKEGTGVLTLLGVISKTSIPGRPQGKGLMERAVKTIHTDLAKRFASCVHRNMDQDTARTFRLSVNKDIKKYGKSEQLPTFGVFFEALCFRIDEYNATPHTALPKFTDANGKRRHYSPGEYWNVKLAENPEYKLLRLNPTLHDDLFMPAAERPVHNNWINFAGKKYYADALWSWNGKKVLVRYDMHDPRYIVVQTPDMVKICRALVDGNTIDYLDMISEAERKAGVSQRAKLARAQAQVQKKLPGATVVYNGDSIGATATVVSSIRPIGQVVDVEPLAALETDFSDEEEGTLTQSVRPGKARPAFEFPYERYEYHMTHPDSWTQEDRDWLEWYVQTEEYADYLPIFISKGIAWEETSCAKCS